MFEMVASYLSGCFFSAIDPRVKDKFLMGSPTLIIITVTCYLTFSVFLKRYIDSQKKSYFVHSIFAICIFNFYAFVFSTYLLYKIVRYMIWSNYNIRCTSLDLSEGNETLEVESNKF